jgi:hypothetical protein
MSDNEGNFKLFAATYLIMPSQLAMGILVGVTQIVYENASFLNTTNISLLRFVVHLSETQCW